MDAAPPIAADGVRRGVLPLKLNTGADGRELDRAKLLLASLQHFWRGRQPFRLHVVAATEETAEISRVLDEGSASNVGVTVHAEDEFFAPRSAFFATKGMYKQQLIKLWAPVKLGLAAFIAFDADVVCIRRFDERTFVHDGRLVSKWEDRSLHSWWTNSMAALDICSDLAEPGLGVTPNVLHARICEQVFRYLEQRGFDPIARLCALTEAHPELTAIEGEGIPLSWSEYSLYTLAGEWSGELERLHVPAATVAQLGIKLQSDRCVWRTAQLDRLKPAHDPAYFLVVQSWAGLPPHMIEARAGLRFSAAQNTEKNLFYRLFQASPAAAWAEIEAATEELSSRIDALAARTEGLRALFEGVRETVTMPRPAIYAPTRWTYDVRLPNLYFANVFEPEITAHRAKTWVKRPGALSARLELPRTVQYDFTIAVVDFALPECEASFRLRVDGEMTPWLAIEGRRFSSIIQENKDADHLSFEVSVDPAALPQDKDVSFSFSWIDIVRRGAE